MYGFNAKYNIGKFGIDGEWVSIWLSDSDIWNVGVKWGDYKLIRRTLGLSD